MSAVDLGERAEDFERLLGDLAEIVRRSGVEELDEQRREYLRTAVRCAVSGYGVLRWSKDDAAASEAMLRELKTPLRTVIEILKRPISESVISYTLGKGNHPSGYCDIELGSERRKALIAALEEIAAGLPPSRRMKPRGNPGNADLYQLVHTLANDWRVITGLPVTQMSDGAPKSGAAQFIHAVVKFVNPGSLGALRHMLEKVVAERRKGIVTPWLNLTPGNRPGD